MCGRIRERQEPVLPASSIEVGTQRRNEPPLGVCRSAPCADWRNVTSGFARCEPSAAAWVESPDLVEPRQQGDCWTAERPSHVVS